MARRRTHPRRRPPPLTTRFSPLTAPCPCFVIQEPDSSHDDLPGALVPSAQRSGLYLPPLPRFLLEALGLHAEIRTAAESIVAISRGERSRLSFVQVQPPRAAHRTHRNATLCRCPAGEAPSA